MVERRRFFGLVNRRERWGLSLFGWIVLLGLATALLGITLFSAHDFLAKTEREETSILVVEGWVHPFACRFAAEEFRAHGYTQVFCTGGPVVGMGGYTNDYNTSANVGAANLRAAGIPSEVVKAIPCRSMKRDRTYSSAVALRRWLEQNNLEVRAMNVITEDAHGRRTQLLFERAFSAKVKVGVISVPSPDYDAKRWWRYSEGVREVISEGTAYLYAKFLFFPPQPEDS